MSRSHLNIEQVATLLALVESGSFAEAGRRLDLAQSTVSQQLQRLEDALGVRLIRRDQRGCLPTAEALRALPYARSILQLEARLRAAAAPAAPRLGACSNIGVYLLPELLRGFREAGGAPPEIVIAANPQIADDLERGEIDAALLEWWDERPGFRWQFWRSEPLVVIVAPDHPWSRRRTITREEVLSTPLIGGEHGTGTGRLLRGQLAGASDMAAPSMQLGSTEAVKRAVAAGLGVSLTLACAVAVEVREARLCTLSVEDNPLAKSLCLVWRKDLPASDPLLAFLRCCHD